MAIALLLGLAVAPVRADEGESAADCFIRNFTANDADAVTACYAADAVLWIPGQPMAKGTEQIHAAFAGYFAAFTVKEFTIEKLGGQAVGDDAATWGTFRLVAVAKSGGAETVEVGRFLDVSRRVDGKWVYVVDHASDDPAPAPAPAKEM
jgi:ketosteroid isomerase-like protein